MMTLRQFSAEPSTIPTITSWYLADLSKAQGKQELFTHQSPQKLKILREHALIESAVSSNRIEGVNVDQSRIDTLILGKTLLKDRAEADRFYNYPFDALEEALVNAVYHRSYEIREPVEVRILPDHVTITSYPGPDRSIKLSDLQSGSFISRRYRNRRIGEFLKELNMTEGRGTGIPKILRAMKANGSPDPRFETDDDRTYFVSYFPAHSLIVSKETAQAGLKLGPSRDQVQLLEFTFKERSIAELMELFKWQNRTKFRTKYIKPLIDVGWLTMTIPDKPQSSKQRYIMTEAGKDALKTEICFGQGSKEENR